MICTLQEPKDQPEGIKAVGRRSYYDVDDIMHVYD